MPRPPRPPRSGKISKIAQALATDVLTVRKVNPGRKPKGDQIPGAPPQGNRQAKVVKVQNNRVIKRPGVLKKPMKDSAKKALRENLSKFVQGRATKSFEVVRDLRGELGVA